MLTPILKQQLGTWYPVLSHLFDTEWMQNLGRHLGQDVDKLCPPVHQIFRAFTLTPIEKVKVVIIGMEPYPKPGVADGLAFSSGNGTEPYSLKIINDRLEKLYSRRRTHFTLDDWAEQGVLLINPVLTTVAGKVNAHENIGWQQFTATALNAVPQKVIWVAWGTPSREFLNFLLESIPGWVLKCRHPASVRHGYRFTGMFMEINEALVETNQSPIKWV